jgi:hypothetical protein
LIFKSYQLVAFCFDIFNQLLCNVAKGINSPISKKTDGAHFLVSLDQPQQLRSLLYHVRFALKSPCPQYKWGPQKFDSVGINCKYLTLYGLQQPHKHHLLRHVLSSFIQAPYWLVPYCFSPMPSNSSWINKTSAPFKQSASSFRIPLVPTNQSSILLLLSWDCFKPKSPGVNSSRIVHVHFSV